MKTYVITVSKTFLKGHPKEGEPTEFKKAILAHRKIHTIRGNYKYWSKVLDEVKAGRAILSVREWTGKPYRTKQREITYLTSEDGVGYQPIKIDEVDFTEMGNHLPLEWSTLATNDGLSWKDFYNWFKAQGELNQEKKKIIHFTKFRY